MNSATSTIAVALIWSMSPYVQAQSLQEIAAFAQQICGDIPEGEMTTKQITGRIKGDIAGVAKIVGVSVTADGKLDYGNSKYVGIPYDKLPREIPTVAQCKVEVTKLVTALPKKKVISYASCRHPDFGLERWQHSVEHSNSSGWRGGGGDQNQWCEAMTASFLQSRRIGPQHVVTRKASSEESKKDWKGHVEYKYHCTIRVQWGPIFFERTDARCGIIES